MFLDQFKENTVLRIFDFSQGFSKKKNWKIRDFQIFRKSEIFQKFGQPKKNLNIEKNVFAKISKLHRKTFEEHLTTPPNSS